MDPTAKVISAMNSVSNKEHLWDLIGYIDPSTMTRFLWLPVDEGLQKWINDKKETPDFIKLNEIMVHNIASTLNPPEKGDREKSIYKEKEKDDDLNVQVVNHFLTIYDSSQSILSSFDIKDIKSTLNKYKVNIPNAVLPIWEPREQHHTKLLLDGIVKTCVTCGKTIDFSYAQKYCLDCRYEKHKKNTKRV